MEESDKILASAENMDPVSALKFIQDYQNQNKSIKNCLEELSSKIVQCDDEILKTEGNELANDYDVKQK